MDHVSTEEGLSGLSLLANADVGQQLSLQDLPGILYARLLGDSWNAPTLAYVIQSHLQMSTDVLQRLYEMSCFIWPSKIMLDRCQVP